MAEWRSMMLELGFENARTLIATGNAIFERRAATVSEVEAKLEEAFERHFGRRVDTIVRGAASFRRMAEGNPFPEESKQDGSRVAVRVMRSPLDADAITALKPYLTQGERLKLVEGDVWVHFKGDPNRSSVLRVLASKRLGVGTVRNWNTIRRLNSMLG